MVDEGLDLYFYGHFGAFLLWMLLPGANFWVLFLGLVNLPFHTAEIKFYITKSLKFIVDELGPVEVEFIFGTIVSISGLFASNFWQYSLAQSFGVDWKVFEVIQWKYFLLTLVAVLYVLFANDNLKDAFKENVGRTFYCLVPTLLFILMAVAHSWLQTFKVQTFLIYLLYMYSYNLAICRLMISNMSQQLYSFWGLELLYPLVVIIVGLTAGLTLE